MECTHTEITRSEITRSENTLEILQDMGRKLGNLMHCLGLFRRFSSANFTLGRIIQVDSIGRILWWRQIIRFHDVRTRAMKFPIDDSPASPDARCNFTGILWPIIFSRRETGCSGFGFRARGRVSVSARVVTVLRPETCEIRSNGYSREMSFHVKSNAINVIDPLNVRSPLKRQHVSRVRHIYVHTSVRFQWWRIFFNSHVPLDLREMTDAI